MKEGFIVFLGGTGNGSTWRERLIPMLHINYFNPLVSDWSNEAAENEKKHRTEDDLILYVLTPKMEGVYSVAEAVDDSNKRPDKVIVCAIDSEDEGEVFSHHQWKSIERTLFMIEENGATIAYSLNEVASIINSRAEE